MTLKPTKFVPKRRWLYPVGAEREYQRFAKAFAKELFQSTQREIVSKLGSLVSASTIRSAADRADGLAERIAELMVATSRPFSGPGSDARIEAEIRKIARQLNRFNDNQFRQVMRSAVQVDVFVHEPWLVDLTEMWVSENVRLIKSIPERYFGSVEGIARRGLMAGTLTNNMGAEIKRLYEVTDRRAQLIARDQVGKLNGDLAMHRQTTVGIGEYQWSTSKDSRVRPDHHDREGRIFKWSEPPGGGHPGKAIHCRCVALPVIDFGKLRITGKPTKDLLRNPVGGILEETEIDEPRSLGAAGGGNRFTVKRDIPVIWPKDAVLREGSTVTGVKTIAEGSQIRDVQRLIATYLSSSGKPTSVKDWLKKRGTGDVDIRGESSAKVELHWYEARNVGKVEMKVKREIKGDENES